MSPIRDEPSQDTGSEIFGYFDNLLDVNLSGLFDGAYIRWDATVGAWLPASGAGAGASDLDDLTDVNIAGATFGQFLMYGGVTSGWIPGTPVDISGGVSLTGLDMLYDVTLGTQTFGQFLMYGGAISGWVPGIPANSGTISITGQGYVQYQFDITRTAYGAIGNGVFDCTSGIQACVNAAIASGGPQTVFFPPGTYMIQDPGTGSYAGSAGGLIRIPTGAADITLYGPDATLLVGPNGSSEATVRVFGARCKVIGLTRNLNAASGDPSYRKTKDNTGFELNGSFGGITASDCEIRDCKCINGYGADNAITQGTSDFIVINGNRCKISNCQSFYSAWNAFRVDGNQIVVENCVGAYFRGNGVRINEGDFTTVRNCTLTTTYNHGRAGILADAGSGGSFNSSGLPYRTQQLTLDNNFVYINPNGAGLGTDLSPEGAGSALKIGSTIFAAINGGYYGAGSATNNFAVRLEDCIKYAVFDNVRIDPQVVFTTADDAGSSIYQGLVGAIISVSGRCQLSLSGSSTALQNTKSLYVHGSIIEAFNREYVVQSRSGLFALTDLAFPLSDSTGVVPIATGAGKIFAVQTGSPFAVGARLRAYSAAIPTNFMEGIVTARADDGTGITPETVTMTVDTIGGTGTYQDWKFSLRGDGKVFARSGVDKVRFHKCVFGGPTFAKGGDNNEGPMFDATTCRVLEIEGCEFTQGGAQKSSYNAISWFCNFDLGYDLIRIVDNDFIFNTDALSSHVGRMINPYTTLNSTVLTMAGKTIAYNNRLTNIGMGAAVIANSANANYNRQILFSTDGENKNRYLWGTAPNTADSNTVFLPGQVIIQTGINQIGKSEWLCVASGQNGVSASSFVLRDAPYKFMATSSGTPATGNVSELTLTPTAGLGSKQFGNSRALVAGEAFRTMAAGVFSSTGSPTLTIRAKLGEVGETGEKTIATLTIPTTNASGLRWKYNICCVVKDVGAVGTVRVVGDAQYETSTDVWVEKQILEDILSTNTSNTSHNRKIGVSSQWTVASGQNSATCAQFQVMPW